MRVSRAVVVATGVTMGGGCEVLGCAVGDSDDGKPRGGLQRAGIKGGSSSEMTEACGMPSPLVSLILRGAV